MTPRATPPPRRSAVLYLRLSDARDDSSTSIERQRNDLTVEAERRGLSVVAELVDDGVSGRKSRARAFEALGMLREGRADALLVWKFDRWSRQGLSAVSALIDALDARPAALFVAMQDGLNSDQPAWRIIASVLAEVARMEAENTSARVSSFVRHAKEVGRWHGGRAPVGYRSVPHPSGTGRALEPDPQAVELLTDAARRIVAGEALFAVTQRLNASTLKPPSAAAWSFQTVRRALMGHSIVGRVSARVPGSTPEERKFDVLRDEEGNPRQVWEPVLPLDLWRACRATLEARNAASPLAGRKRATFKRARLLSGLLVCAYCGGPMYAGVTGEGVARYSCSKRSRAQKCRPEGGGAPAVTAHKLEDYVEGLYLKSFGSKPLFSPVAREVPALALAEASDALAAVSARLADPDLDESAEDRLEAQQRALRRRVRELAAQGPPPAEVELVNTGETIAQIWERADIEERRAFLSAAIVHITVANGQRGGKKFDPERFGIVWRPSPEELGVVSVGNSGPRGVAWVRERQEARRAASADRVNE
ncbi:recombinase family protein [Microbacterium sufflavum]|uniref:Recombinase family protein n=1 Tax=Microbacterium sufflavum TaxID=2851649 RepID=A0ABY4IKY3_9MICO|nr:recombinase family protein [Microbacterium sufflavum]UPL12591.1 recombinase family protein [Microbacterium sufflavum]